MTLLLILLSYVPRSNLRKKMLRNKQITLCKQMSSNIALVAELIGPITALPGHCWYIVQIHHVYGNKISAGIFPLGLPKESTSSHNDGISCYKKKFGCHMTLIKAQTGSCQLRSSF
ncbi:hypothetical protein NPIL_562791 [Nephila pilipes]|uniref:Uncharacterized protein n=1 Tax=Nephila pilipes TaxID=299642 RepID=A0A8X6UND4_NEPPI|nr:hypothetical protein NPIL_562791 [Nephila pilipes]